MKNTNEIVAKGETGNRLPTWQVGPVLTFIASINDSGGMINKR